ncbi:MAG: zinc-binding dehydrogenase [Clostridiales bacterium]|jgi:threonine dehydrogenase-like Zn-dependent dehydrogenase|nr:zinc-binding dehydrogenase [Clostridiales bacterium]
MKTTALRLYGENDLRLETFELPALREGEVLCRIISDSICMSSHKAAIQGARHKRVPNDVASNPVIIGHEFCGEVVEVGKKHEGKIRPGQKFTVQPAMNYKGSQDAPGYSFPYIGGAATYIVIPEEVFLTDCFLPYGGSAFFYGSLAEPMSCIVGAFHANYHTENGSYAHRMGVAEGGNACILAGAGPMGLGAVDYALNCDRRPGLLAVTDIDGARLERAASILPPSYAQKRGVKLVYVNTAREGAEAELTALTGGAGYDDVFVFAPVRPVVEQGGRLLARDGCLNFFAGPTDPAFKAEFNFYNVHYASAHIVGTSGGNTDDMRESIKLMQEGAIDPAVMITHVGGLNSARDTTLNLPKIPGGKKLVYCQIDMPMTALADLQTSADPLLKELGRRVKENNGLWSADAERYLLQNGKPIMK